MFSLFQNLMQNVPSDQPVVYICYFAMCICTFGAFMRFLYSIFRRW